MKIVLLTIDYVPYHVIFIKTLISRYEAEVHSFSVSDVYGIPKNIESLYTYEMKFNTNEQVVRLIEEISPQIVFVGGWVYKSYNWICSQVRKKLRIPIVAACDSQWLGGRQWGNVLLSRFRHHKWFTHVFVSGVRQYVYARKLGFTDKAILLHNYSCDVNLFNTVRRVIPYPKRFVFVGRLVPEKGIDYLVKAWNAIPDKRGWELLIIGSGSLKGVLQLQKDETIILKDSMSQEYLIDELSNSGCFVLSSTFEPWAVVIHEVVAAGLPVICTDVCGAAAHFVINNYNGYQISSKSTQTLKSAMEKIIGMSEEELSVMSTNSRKLSTRITPESSAAAFMSVLNFGTPMN